MLPILPEQASLSSSLCSDIWICFPLRCRRRRQEQGCSTQTQLFPPMHRARGNETFPLLLKGVKVQSAQSQSALN